MNNGKDVLDRLATGEFNVLIGIAERVWHTKECPRSWTQLRRIWRLQKDISSAANDAEIAEA